MVVAEAAVTIPHIQLLKTLEILVEEVVEHPELVVIIPTLFQVWMEVVVEEVEVVLVHPLLLKMVEHHLVEMVFA
jgi:hypothetical protein